MFKISKSDKTNENRFSASSDTAAAASSSKEATDIALSILNAGGNAVDAAIAASFALAVCEPEGSGIGGQASMFISNAAEIKYLDGHSYAPQNVSLKTVTARNQKTGFRSTTIPSMVATLQKAHMMYGTLSWDELIRPAIALAKFGFTVTPLMHRQALRNLKNVHSQKGKISILRKKQWIPNEKLRQPELAKTLHRIAIDGADDFYRGALALEIHQDMRTNGGLLNYEDLSDLDLPIDREPLSFSYRDYDITTASPPAGGLQLAVALKILEKLFDSKSVRPEQWYRAVSGAVYGAFDAREKFPVHADDFSSSYRDWALSDKRIDELIQRAYYDRYNTKFLRAAEGAGETTHLSIADSDGMVVSLTQSLQSLFGAKVGNKKLGFLYNNYLTSCTRYAGPFQIGNNSVPRSNIAPSIVSRNGQPVLALGSAGSRRIISSLVQVISGVLDLNKSLPDAISAPRVHPLLNGDLWLEKSLSKGLPSSFFDDFKRVTVKSGFVMGGVQAIKFDENKMTAVADRRRNGAAGGLS